MGSLPGFLASMACGLAGGPSGVGGWGKVTKERGRLEGDPQAMEGGERVA